MSKKLTDRQKRFIDEYVIDFNATQAAVRAGYSKKTANQIGPENLVKLGEEIKARTQEFADKTEDTIQKLDEDILKAYEISSATYVDKNGNTKMVDSVMAKACLEMRGRRKAAFIDTMRVQPVNYVEVLTGAQEIRRELTDASSPREGSGVVAKTH